jgi:hypothetical protein
VRNIRRNSALHIFVNIVAVLWCVTFLEVTARTRIVPVPVAVPNKPSAQKKKIDQPKIVEVQKRPVKVVEKPVIDQKPLVGSGKLSLEEIHTISLQQSRNNIPMRSKPIIPAQKSTDLFTQSQAHMSIPEIKNLINAKYDIKPYQSLIDSVLKREKEYADDYVFYHGLDNVWRVPQDLYTRLYAHFKLSSADAIKNFIFLRFEDIKGPTSAQDFLINQLQQTGLLNDHTMGPFLLAVNLALFGNVGVDPECTWQYFIKSRGHTKPDHSIYEKIMTAFGLPHKHINELMSLVQLYQTKEQTILQIFVPKNKVDSIGYLAWIRGNPAHQKTMDLVLRSVENKIFPKTAPALDNYTAIFRREKEANPTFKHLLERVKAGEYSLSYFLEFYRNRPNEIQRINNYQARLFFTPEVLLNPFSGVKIFRYSMATSTQLKNYQQKFDSIINKILSEKK